jgi:hypothetical protein
VVAIVSLHGFNPASWTAPATLIAKTTNLPVAAIIMTKSDFARDTGSSLTSEQILENAFWKTETVPNAKLGVSSRCSVVGSRGAHALLDLVNREGKKPSFDIFSKMPYTGVSPGLPSAYLRFISIEIYSSLWGKAQMVPRACMQTGPSKS